MNSPRKIIEIRDLRRTFYIGNRHIDVLKGINLEVYEGEMIGIFGPSGSGKSTLLHLLAYLDRATGGEILYLGKNLNELSDKEISTFRALNLGFVFQFHHLLPEFSVIENIMLPMLIKGTRKKEAKLRALDLLTLVGLRDRAKQKPETLSGGERQRVAVARAMANSPPLILADEPTGNLDRENTLSLMDLLLKLNKEKGMTQIVVSHDEDLAKYFTKVFYLEYGVLRRIDEVES